MMGILAKLLRFFRGEADQSSDQQWREGYEAFSEGERLLFGRQPREALPFLDKAISLGFEGADVYASRGSCLQSLEYNFDAINDFNTAIEFEATDSNFYFTRSISKGASGDLQGQVADLLEAIRVSDIDNATNRSHNAYAQENGYKDIADFYGMTLLGANLNLEQQASDEIRLKGPSANIGSDLASRLRSKTKRRGEGA